MCRYAQSCAFISVIELPRIPAYCPKLYFRYKNTRKKEEHIMPTENYKFPADFVWGAATSSYQIEGAVSKDGKGEDIWDVFTREDNRIFEHHTGEIACDHYHRFREDVKLMKEMGLHAYRFSINWSRVLPNGYGHNSLTVCSSFSPSLLYKITSASLGKNSLIV